jgi:hypothetical protein
MTIDYGFNVSEYKIESNNLPVGKYKAMICAEEIKESENANNPKYLSVTYEIVDGEFKGLKKTHNYNLFHTNSQTVNIARGDIKRIELATGKPVSPTTPLRGRVLTLVVTTNKKNPDFVDVKYLPQDEANNADAPF